MPIYHVIGSVTQRICLTYDAPNAEAARIGDDCELIEDKVLDEKDFVVESVEEIEQALPILPSGEVWCEGFADSGTAGEISCSICNFYGNTDFPPEWARIPSPYGEQWPCDARHGYRHPQTPFIIGDRKRVTK